MIWSYFDLAWHNLQTISEWFGVGIEVAEFGAHETRHEVLCCFCNASCISRYLLLCTWGWEPGMVQRVSNVKVCSSALCVPAPAAERDLQRVHWLQHCSRRLVLSNCSGFCSMRAAAATALNRLLPPLPLARDMPGHPHWASQVRHINTLDDPRREKWKKQIEILLSAKQTYIS